MKKCRAKTVVLTHFGMRLLQAKPWEVAERLSQETGLKVITTRDGMTLEVDNV